jgi:ribulose-phosphate 3-epimerase
MKTHEVIPAILAKDFEEIEKKVALVDSFAPFVQLDVADGIFVPSTTWNKPEELLPLTASSAPEFEIDLMVSKPEDSVDAWIASGARRLVIHVESTLKHADVLHRVKAGGLEVGFAMRNDTPEKTLDAFVDKVDFVQFMGISRLGYQGEIFDERVLGRIRAFRARHKDCIISVDGGVNLTTAPRLLAAGANRLVAGSVIWESGDVAGTIEKLRHIKYDGALA